MKKSTKILLSSVAASIIFIGCGGGSSTTASTTGTVSGTAVDGPVSYAKVCLDLNFNQKCDSNEPTATTDADGKFSMTYNLNDANASIAPVLMLPTPDSVDTFTGNKVTIAMSAPRAGHNTLVVSPITTVAAAAIYQDVENNVTVTPDTVKNVIDKVAQALDLNGTDITQVNPSEDAKLLVTAVTLSNIISDGNITQVASNIVDKNETNITKALPADYQSVYNTIVNAVDENTSLDNDKLQQLVESSLETNDTAVIVNILSDKNITDSDIAQALVEGQLNVIYNDLNKSGLLAFDSDGYDYNITDMNTTYTAQILVNDYNITDAKTLMTQYASIGDINISANSETNLSSAVDMYNTLQSVKAFKNGTDVDLINLNFANITIFRQKFNGSPRYFDQNGTFIDYTFNEDTHTYAEDANGKWLDLDNVLVLKFSNLEKPVFLGIENSKDISVPVVGYDTNLAKELSGNVIITNLTPNTEVNSSLSVEQSILNGQFGEFNATDINGSTFTTGDGTKITLDSNGSCLIDGKNIGSWEVDSNGAVVLPYYDGKVYVLKGKDLNEYSTEAYFAFVDANGHVMSIQETPFTKYVENADAVLLAKNIFSSLRTQIDSISNAENTGTLDNEANKFNEQLKDITYDNVESAGNTLVAMIDSITNKELTGSVDLDNPDLNRTFTLSTNDNKTYNYSIKDDLNGTVKEYNGTITFNTDISNITTSQSFDVSMDVIGQLPASDEQEIAQDINTSMELKYDATNYIFDLLINKMNVTDENKSIEASNINIEAAGTDQNLSDLKYVKLNSFDINGKAGDFEADGSVKVNYVQNSYIAAEGDNQAFKYFYNINGQIVCTDIYGDINDNMTVPNELNVTVDGTTYTLPVNTDQVYYWINTTVASSQDIDENDWYYSLGQAVQNQVVCNDANYTAQIYSYIDESDEFYNAGWIPNSITFNGTVKDVNTSTTLTGTIEASSDDIGNVDFNKTESINSVISLSVKLIRENFADTNVKSKFTSSIDGTTTLDFSYNVDGTDFGTITLSGKWDKNGNGTVTVTSTTGLKAVIPVVNGDIDYANPIPVYVTGKVVGYIEQRDGVPVIKYNDGTFESIN